jgi:hypothetical protein
MKIKVDDEKAIDTKQHQLTLRSGEGIVLGVSLGDDDDVIVTFDGPGGGSDDVFPIFIQDAAPVTTSLKYLWIDTSGSDIAFWVEDGV